MDGRPPQKGPDGGQMKAARAWALRALARRARSVHEMRRGLLLKGFPEGVAESVIEALLGSGLLDDPSFAARWVAVRSGSKRLGPLRLAHELRQRGVPEGIIRSALAEGLDRETEAGLARQAAERKIAAVGKSGPRAVAALLRHLRSRGFSPDAIRKALAGLGEDPSDGES